MNFKWRFNRLPKEEYNNVIEAIRLNDMLTLIKIHDKYNLSNNNYCCGSDDRVINWFKHAINKNIIYEI